MPTPKAMIIPFNKKIGELLILMEAVAVAPSEPTIAVSAKLTSVEKICSTKTGQASNKMVLLTLLDSSIILICFRLDAIYHSPSLFKIILIIAQMQAGYKPFFII